MTLSIYRPILLTLPPELQSMIASHLDAPSLARYKLVSKTLCTWTPDPPVMRKLEWLQFNREFEARLRRGKAKTEGRLLSLACFYCNKIYSKNLFSDEQARKSWGTGRKCITCQIILWGRKPKTFLIGGIEHFGCVGCLQAKMLEEEDVEPVVCRRHTFNMRFWGKGYRWCKECSRPLRNLYHVQHGWWLRT